ncbi:ABC transporter permease [Micromonospora sp. C95]|uniref:ABC transporter permease n=1 Tax=Micromonospora sp. C95 TaxID=2824882 RepID=UPI001B35D09D|nr:ABC transporter permease subunit [Micromonospora sp. C95]MBQ1026019.1 ABC transporter permease subunit [Micromonospora sp. C95]
MSRPDTWRHQLSTAALALCLTFLACPLALVVWIGLSDAPTISLRAGGLTLRSIEAFLADPAWADAARRSLVMAVIVAALAVAAGSLAAYVNVRQTGRLSILTAGLMILPAVVPTVLYALGLVLLAARIPLSAIELVVIGQSVLATPLAFLVMRIGLHALRPEQVEAARLLGARWHTTLLRVVVPPLVPYAAVSAAMAASLSLAEPVLAIFLVNDAAATLPQKSFQGLRFSFDPRIMTAAAFIVLLTAVVTIPALLLAHRRRMAVDR